MFDPIGLSVEEKQSVRTVLDGFDPAAQDAVASLFAGLNREQVAALAHPISAGRPLLILAGAGSGKTSVLTRRVALLLLAGVPAERMFVATFTVKAAGEMKERIGKLILDLAARVPPHLKPRVEELLREFPRSWIGTFHSLCLRLLKEIGEEGFSPVEELGYPPAPTVLSDSEARNLLKTVAESLPVKPDLRDLAVAIERAANDLLTPEALAGQKTYGGLEAVGVADAWQKFVEAKRAQGAVDFTDLLYLTATAFADRRMCAERWRSRFTHVLIDEYQDTNIAQYAIATEMAAAQKNLFVVGDDDQSIYGFRGADIRNIRAFTQDYPDARTVRLIRNYRSTAVILGAANALLASRTDRDTEKMLIAAAPQEDLPEKITVYEARDDRDEINFAVFQIRELMAEGFQPKDIVIFYRVHQLAAAAADRLREEQIPFLEIGGRLMAHPFVETARALFDAVHLVHLRRIGRFDSVRHAFLLQDALRRIWSGAKLGPKNRTDRTMLLNLPAPERILLDERAYVEAVRFCQSGESQIHLERLWSALHGGAQGVDTLTPVGLLNLLNDTLGLEAMAADDADIRSGMALFRRFLSARLPYAAAGREGLDLLIAAFQSIDRGESDIDLLQDNVVRLLTIHAAKGLEFPAVIVIGVEEEILPFVHPAESKDETPEDRLNREEEELRLFYVAITRAKKRLILTSAARRTWFGREVTHPPSRYLSSLPRELVNRASALSTADRAAHRTRQFFKDLFKA